MICDSVEGSIKKCLLLLIEDRAIYVSDTHQNQGWTIGGEIRSICDLQNIPVHQVCNFREL